MSKVTEYGILGDARSYLRNLSVRAKSSVIVAVSVSLIIFAFFLISIYYSQQALRVALEERGQSNADIQVKALSLPLWNYDLGQVDIIVNALAEDSAIVGAIVVSNDGSQVSRMGKQLASANHLIIEKPITFEISGHSRKIGQLTLLLSTDSIRHTFYRDLMASAIECLLLILVLSYSICKSLNYITAPLVGVADCMQRYLAGEHDVPLPEINSNDEIGSLTRTFGTIRNDLEALHKDLEAKVRERTRQLEDAKENALAASAAKSEFVANMSHEIRTPLNGVLGFIEVLRATDLSADQQDYLEMIHCSADSLLAIVDDILDFSRIQAKKLEITSRPFNLAVLLKEVENLFRLKVNQKEIVFKIVVSEHVPPTLIGDPQRIKQVLINLIGNAIKFTDQFGSIQVVVNLEKLVQDRATLRISVSDTGIGISSDQHKRIFEPFAQADHSTTRQFGGTGLGLAISSSIVRMMGGNLDVISKPGVGSVFSFCIELPVAISDAENETGPVPQLPPIGQLKILLAEDNLINQKLAVRILQNDGHHVTVANNGRETIELYSKHTFDLILMDCQMPVIDGYEAVKEIRELEKGTGRRTRIMAITANAIEGDREKCLEVGMDDYISKPVNRIDLLQRIRKLVNREV